MDMKTSSTAIVSKIKMGICQRDYRKNHWCNQDCAIGDNPNIQLLDVECPRNENRDYDPNGQYVDQQVTCQVKYIQQVQQCWGVYLKNIDGEEIGCQMPVFDYSDKTLLSYRWENESKRKSNDSRS